MKRLTTFVLARPRTVLTAWVVVLLGSAAFVAGLTGALKAGGFTNPRADAMVAQSTIERAFGEAPNSLLIVLRADSGDVTARVDRAIEAVPRHGVVAVDDYRHHPEWISADRRTTFVKVDFGTDNTTVQNLVPAVQRAVSLGVGHGVAVNVTGQPALDYQLNVHSKEDASRAEMIAFPVLIIVLLLVFRSVAAMIVPLVMAGVSLAVSSAIGFGIAHVTDLSILYTNIVSMIGLAVAVDYSLFIIKRFREELADGSTVDGAVRTAMRTAGHSVVFSGIAVIVGLSALFIPRIMAFTSIAVGGIVVALVALALSTTALPAVLKLLGSRINWGAVGLGQGSKPSATSTVVQPPKQRGVGDARGPGGRIYRRPGLLLSGLVVAFAVIGFPVVRLSLQSPVASATILPSGDYARTGMRQLKDNIGQRGLFPVQVVLDASARATPQQLVDTVDQVVAVARASSDVVSVQGVTTLGIPTDQLATVLNGAGTAGAPGPAAAALSKLWVSHDGATTTRVIVIPKGDPDATSTHHLVTRLRADVKRLSGHGVDIKITGATAQGVDFDDTVVRSLPVMIGAVIIVTFVVLVLAFRSVLTPLLALAFNGMVVLGAMGVLTMVFQAWLGRVVNSVTPLLLFAVMFGLSMDYMVIMISRIREAYEAGNSHREAVLVGLYRTAGMVNGGAAIMVAVFAAFGTAQISIVQELGVGLGIAVLLDALVVRLFVMPATLLLIGPRIWGGTRRRAPQRTAGSVRQDLVTAGSAVR